MSKKDDQRPRKRLRKRRRKRRRPAPETEQGPPRGEEVLEVGKGEFCVVTIPVDEGPTVVHRFESREEAQEQHRKNVAADAPLVGVDDELN